MTYRFSNKITTLALEFIRTAREEAGDLGADRVYAMMDAFDPELRDELMFRLITGEMSGPIRIKFSKINGYSNKIQAIKTVRAISGMGLKEAKEFVEIAEFGGIAVMNGSFDVKQRQQFADGLIGTGFIVV
jgi:formylmethanofuran:tetrahydromethanopterin formyltransferase